MSGKLASHEPTKAKMRNTQLLMELEALAERLGIQVIHEKLPQSRGGLCRLHDQYILFIEKNLSDGEQVDLFVSALSRFPLEHFHVLPRVRQLLATDSFASQAQIEPV